MKSIRVAVAAAAVGIALTACSSPVQAGAAAVVGNERISTSQLTTDAEAYKAALKRNNLDETALGVPITQYVLQRLADISAAKQFMASRNVQVTDKEIDAKLQDPGQYQNAEINLLALGVAPTYAREYARTAVGMAKLQQAAGQAGTEQLRKEFSAIKTTFNPRFGVVNPSPSQENPSLFIDAGRFGKAATQQAQQQQQQG
ncbi:SurA N-terminal domain-containing protein [Nonomuraea sp. CA-141351]|uniref:SurA N-terminal domain-containing protein n=1 Tax=Nonomuraea sp. CA-141351 TaxID=3239996 RepID=UPI003D8EE081